MPIVSRLILQAGSGDCFRFTVDLEVAYGKASLQGLPDFPFLSTDRIGTREISTYHLRM